MLTVVKKSIDIKAPVDTVFTYFARPEHVSDQMSDKGVGMTVIPMDIKAGMGVGLNPQLGKTLRVSSLF